MTIDEIKRDLISTPDYIVELLTSFDFHNINIRNNEIRFARDENGGQNVRIRTRNNDCVIVNDFVRGSHQDIFAYISSEKGNSFSDVLKECRKIMGLKDDWSKKKSCVPFGGIYSSIYAKKDCSYKVYDKAELDKYIPCGNRRFLADNIPLKTQRKFNIGYNPVTDRISIPVFDEIGQLCGVKCRRNYEVGEDDDDPKYIWELPSNKSNLLYGVYEHYTSLYGADSILIFEAEKSVQQTDGYGYYNTVALMGNTLSQNQCKALIGFNAKEYIFLLDEGLDLNVTMNNINELNSYAAMFDFRIGYWDWKKSKDLPLKCSPSDLGKDRFENILRNEVVYVE